MIVNPVVKGSGGLSLEPAILYVENNVGKEPLTLIYANEHGLAEKVEIPPYDYVEGLNTYIGSIVVLASRYQPDYSIGSCAIALYSDHNNPNYDANGACGVFKVTGYDVYLTADE